MNTPCFYECRCRYESNIEQPQTLTNRFNIEIEESLNIQPEDSSTYEKIPISRVPILHRPAHHVSLSSSALSKLVVECQTIHFCPSLITYTNKQTNKQTNKCVLYQIFNIKKINGISQMK
jgi:hypothetical protein